MKLTLELTEIDYHALVKFGLPLLQGKLAESNSEAGQMEFMKSNPVVMASKSDSATYSKGSNL